MSNQCTNWTGKHKYEGRYDEVPNDLVGEIIRKLIENKYNFKARDYLTTRKVYVCDICKHCGDTIDRIDTKEKE